jgi:Uma2 family endonuclease
LVNCGAPIDGDAIAAPNPVIIVEVVSPGPASIDTGAKLTGYFRVPSVQHYLIVYPTKRHVIHHRRAGDGVNTRTMYDGVIVMDPPGVTVSFDEIYPAA